ncbi:MAG: hypothetical protein ABSG04_12635 [Verrucomicrobiota bacterium]|jgi:metal-responsive CopG/Arc/MetJ family transcriptional regulator
MKPKNQVRSNHKPASRRGQSKKPPAGQGTAPALTAGPGESSKLKTVRVNFPSVVVPMIDQAAAVEGESRDEFILNAVQEKIDREATVKTVWLSLPDCLIAAMDSACARDGLSRQELFERAVRQQLLAIERGAGAGHPGNGAGAGNLVAECERIAKAVKLIQAEVATFRMQLAKAGENPGWLLVANGALEVAIEYITIGKTWRPAGEVAAAKAAPQTAMGFLTRKAKAGTAAGKGRYVK